MQKAPFGDFCINFDLYEDTTYLLQPPCSLIYGCLKQGSLYIEEDYTANLRRKLVAGELDAIVVATPFSATDVVVKKLYDESFVVLLPNGHSLAKKSIIGHQDLLNETLLLLGEGHCFRDQVLEACPAIRQTLDRNNDTSKMIAEGSSLETIKHMVASGLGIT